MAALLTTQLTAPVTAAVSGVLELRQDLRLPLSVIVQGKFIYGSGGLTASAWVQTSVDGGGTWTDVANFSFTTSSSRSLYNLSALTPGTTAYAPTDGTMAANTSKDGIIGSQWRVKYTTTGTYVATTLEVDIGTVGLTI
jgi:hypothetical protein